MFIPEIFKDDDPASLRARITANPLGTLVLQHDGGLEANHIPFVLSADEQGEQLLAHIPRANPLSQLTGSHPALVIFHGPQGYITPSWYASKAEHGKVVPTWNYAVTQVHGQLRVVDDGQWVQRQIRLLTDQQEQGRAQPWAVDDAPAEFIDRMAGALVGLEIRITGMAGKNKASQNQPAANQRSLLSALASEPGAQPMHSLVRAALQDD
ncbi:FMN-binding negative transcriptional regulator [Alcanivorax sp. S6407]|uniref:FMN-binding negative transcriptional regulator n=1 Tax=Alcanivorax sp. S6407 TaxID=2926424 RepID=UPI001FF5AC0A|nr:FMN-binding negative transcriptional regulator [Alcanivorax sp. S6407]MCK0154485.1 FMN-binding negative transcriptional regulator [Alcanivorax sp. S6407]